MRILILPRIWRRAIPAAWKRTQLRHPAKIAGSVAVSALNLLWPGHGILRSSPAVVRASVVGLGCYVVITHDILSARRVGQHISVLWKGRIVESGPADELFESENPFVRQFLSGASAGPLGME